MKWMSCFEGKIAEIAFATNSSIEDALKNHQSIIDAFDEDVAVVMIVKGNRNEDMIPFGNAAQQVGTEWVQIEKDGRKICAIAGSVAASDAWIQDHFFVGLNDDGNISGLFSSGDDTRRWFSGQLIAKYHKCCFKSGCQKLVPGNTLAFGDHLLVGADSAHFSCKEICEPSRKFWNFAPRKVTKLGLEKARCMSLGSSAKKFQPFFHLDLYVAPLGKVEGRIHFSVATLQEEYIYLPGSPHSQWKSVKANIISALCATATQLQAMGFVVHRHPIVLHVRNAEILAYSYHNMKFEQFGETRRAYLPQYDGYEHGLNTKLEEMLCKSRLQIESEFKRLGIETRTIFNSFFPRRAPARGSLHCFTKVLRRQAD